MEEVRDKLKKEKITKLKNHLWLRKALVWTPFYDLSMTVDMHNL